VVVAADLLWDLSCSCSPRTPMWAGGGPAVVFRDTVDGRRSEPGLSLVGAVGVRAGPVVPHVLIRAVVSQRSDVGIGVGLRFQTK
jgi:hypothetical protein